MLPRRFTLVPQYLDAKAQRLSREIQDDVAEYALYAMRQMGVISAGLESKQKVGINQHTKEPLPDVGRPSLSKTETLAIRVVLYIPEDYLIYYLKIYPVRAARLISVLQVTGASVIGIGLCS